MVRRLVHLSLVALLLSFVGIGFLLAPSIATAFTLIEDFTTPQSSGFFIKLEQPLAEGALDVQMADFNGDGAIDVIFDNSTYGGEVWLNDPGTLNFAPTKQFLGEFSAQAMGVGDIDGDGDIDVLVGGDSLTFNSIKVWKNDGAANFTLAQTIPVGGNALGQVALGDLDGDGDLDLFMANIANQPNEVWRNNGAGAFTNSGQALGDGHSTDVALGDLDGDGDLDAFVVDSNVNTVWMNNGAGLFTNSGQQLAATVGVGVTLGDIDRDGDIDAATANQSSTNRLWGNNGAGVFTEMPLPESGTGSHNITFVDADVDGDLDIFISRTDLNLLFFNMGGVQMQTMGTYLNSFQVQLSTSHSYEGAFYDWDGDHDPDLVIAEGVVSGVWRNDGLSSLGVYYRIRDEVLAESERGLQYTTLYYTHAPEITMQTLKNPSMGVTAFNTLTEWKPNLESLVTENRGDPVITQAQVDLLDDLLTQLSTGGSPALQQAIATERAALPPLDTYVGQTMSTATTSILGAPTTLTEHTYMPLIQQGSATPPITEAVVTPTGEPICDCAIARVFIHIIAGGNGIPTPCTNYGK